MSNRNQILFAEDLEDIIEHCGCGRPKGKKIKEQGFVPRGSISAKHDARLAGRQAPAGPNIAAQMAAKKKAAQQAQAAKASAFEKMKAKWAAQDKAKAAAPPPGMKRAVGESEEKSTTHEQELPAQVLKQRRAFRPGEEKSKLMQGQYPRVGYASANRSALT